MKAKKQQHQTQPPDVDMADVAQLKAKAKARPKRTKKAAAKGIAAKQTFAPSAKATKFQQEQHLQIDTQEFADGKTEEEKVVAPPSSTNKKRRRRSAAEIDRKFTCQIAGCQKAYGTESSLTHHQKLKHPDQLAEETQENQVGAFLLPLHTASRNVTIRPATALVTFASDPNLLLNGQHVDDLASSTDIIPPSAKAQRCNARFRSNSLPVASSTDQVDKNQIAPTSNPIKPKPRAKTPRKPRRVPTPHPKKTAAATRRTKIRSKSESLTEINPLQPLEEDKIPHSHSSANIQAAIVPINPSFEWPPSSISAAEHHSTSLSSDDQAIDSDILSVLATCDGEDLADFGNGPPSYQSSTSFGESEDAEMLPVGMECFKIAEHATLPTEFPMNEPEAELGLNAFASLGDDWANAAHLSTHLEKMSVDSPPHRLESAFVAAPESHHTMGRLRSTSDPSYAATPMMFGMAPTSPIPDPFSVKSGPVDALPLQSDGHFQSWSAAATLEPAKVEATTPQQLFWLSGGASVATESNAQPSSQALDELLQRDDALEWKAANAFEGDTDTDYGLGDTTMTSALL
ncbi:hypothetical protein KRP22_007238 [Phytophthora ramorum]|nr:hypothetical protein KRP22_4751 [Phytophthora ramorum]